MARLLSAIRRDGPFLARISSTKDVQRARSADLENKQTP
jgi:hypothetical protein